MRPRSTYPRLMVIFSESPLRSRREITFAGHAIHPFDHPCGWYMEVMRMVSRAILDRHCLRYGADAAPSRAADGRTGGTAQPRPLRSNTQIRS